MRKTWVLLLLGLGLLLAACGGQTGGGGGGGGGGKGLTTPPVDVRPAASGTWGRTTTSWPCRRASA